MAKEPLNLRVESATKKKWKDHIEQNPEIDSLTDLIRLATTQYVRSWDEEDENEIETTAELQKDILNEIQQLRRDVDDVHDKTRVIKQDIPVEEYYNRLYDLTEESLEEIVTARQLIEQGDPTKRNDKQFK